MSSLAHSLPTRELVLQRYRAVRPLGSGGNGSVWLARDEVTGLDVALKIIPREGKAAARAEREALAARRLRHERCVRAYDVGHDAGHVYIAYEYVPGRTMRQALRADEIGDRDAAEIGGQVLDALAHAHRTGIVHRDVKPSNILLEHTDEISVRLLDFGLAQFDGADTLTAVGDVPGTLAYIAPERLAGSDATPASDVWAVGVVLWETLAGQHPFWGMPLQEVALAIERGAPKLATERPDLPRRLLAAVDGALASEPEARPRPSALSAELRAAFRESRAHAPRKQKPLTLPSPRPLSSSPVVTRAVPAVLAAATAAVGVTLLPFWPPALAVGLVLAAAAAALLNPRLGLVLAVATPIFPLGNDAEGAALAYGAFALLWVTLTWRNARLGLLFVVGPLLAPLGALALVPLAVQPVRSPFLRGAQAALAVLAAGFVAAVSGESLPLAGGETTTAAVGPGDSALEAGSVAVGTLGGQPLLLLAALVAAAVAVALPWIRGRSRYGVGAVGAVLVVASVAAGAGIAAIPLVASAWAIAGLLAAGAHR